MTQTASPTQNISPETCRTRWNRDGFLIIPSLLSPQECGELKLEGLRLLKEHSSPGATVHVGCSTVSKASADLAGRPRILEILEWIMPDGIEFLSDKLVYKNAAKSFATPWHIDASYWKNTRPKLSVWIPLDDVNAGNGTLTVIPGSHLKKWQHCSTAGVNNEFIFSIEKEEILGSPVIACELGRGSAVIFSDRLVHGSTESDGKKDRYAIISTYHAPGDESFDHQFAARKVLREKPASPRH